MLRPVRTFQVRPLLPESLKALEEIAYNLRWSWDHETIALFRRLDRDLWETSGHNPVLMLNTISQETLQELPQQEANQQRNRKAGQGNPQRPQGRLKERKQIFHENLLHRFFDYTDFNSFFVMEPSLQRFEKLQFCEGLYEKGFNKPATHHPLPVPRH